MLFDLGISTEIENNLNIHVMGFNTTGLSYYNTGIEMAGVELIKRFSNENVEKTVNSVNLIGATPLDFNDLKNIQSIESFFEDTDIKINSKLFMNSSLEDVKNLFKGDFNIPLSSGGYKISKYLNKKYSMPFLPCIPIGTGKSFIKAYNTFISKDKSYINKNFERREKLLILGDQLISNSIRNELYDMGFNSKICVGTMFGLEKDISFPCDLNIVSESHLREIFKSSDFNRSSNSIRMGTGITLDEANNKEASIAIGVDTKSSALRTVAIGWDAAATGNEDVAYGVHAKASGGQAVALGPSTQAIGSQSTSIGNNTIARGNSSVSIGGDDLNAVASTTPLVSTNPANNNDTLNNTAAADTYRNLTGRNLVDFTSTAGRYIPTEAGDGAVALGVQAKATGALSTAFGTKTSATGVASVALGVGASADKANAVALGAGSTTAATAR